MNSTLITILGKGRDNPKTGYRKATYEFPDQSPLSSAQRAACGVS